MSRLADLSKPLEQRTECQEGVRRRKLKKDDEDDEEFLKDTDIPQKYKRRDKGFWTIFQWVTFILVLGCLATVLAFSKLRKTSRGGLMLWKWALIAMVVFCGRLFAGWIIWMVVIIIERNFLFRKRVLYFVYAFRQGVQNALWLGFALLVWHLLVYPKLDPDISIAKIVTKILHCLLIAVIIVLVKTLLVKVFASSFHVSNYFERIQEALFHQYIIETLSGLPLLKTAMKEIHGQDDKMKLEEEEIVAGVNRPATSVLPPFEMRSGFHGVGQAAKRSREGTQSAYSKKNGKLEKVYPKDEEAMTMEHLNRLDQKNVSAWNMKRLLNMIQLSSLTHSLEETVNAEAVGVQTEIQSEWQAKAAAKRIFKNVARDGHKFISEEDLLRFMRREEVDKALRAFEGGFETRMISNKVFKDWVIKVFKERRALALSLNDTKTAVNKLHRMVDVLIGLIISIICLLVLNIATTQLLLFISSQFLLVILVWANTLRTVLEALVFLFVTHPFDVGDRCVVDGQQLVVEEMNILTTVFQGDCNVKIWYPNAVLATKPIQNYYRSPEMGDSVEFLTLCTTPMSKINDLRGSIKEYLESRPEWWGSQFTLNVMELTEGKRMKLSLGVKHTMNYQDLGERLKRRREFLYELKARCVRLEVDYKSQASELIVHLRRQEGATPK